MGLYTNFIKLFKPDGTEKYSINVFNENSDLIDSALKQLDEKISTKASNSTDGILSKEDHIKYEDANNRKHEHDNKSILDKLSESENGTLLYDGEEINSCVNDDHTHGNMKTITFSTTEPTSVSDGEIVMVYEE